MRNEVIASLCETVGIDGADASGGAGDEGSAVRRRITHDLLLFESFKFEQDLPASIWFQRLVEGFFELVERIHMVHRG